ncbi:hypothetical protein PAMC26577_13830 [Caballeronia sordidicola]|uniref:Uncharacterized protein n=1 Tax=Caballeronia sordidicola TaxID=196367 RepID=A0A242MV82_CABSO|nr:hypothetical protein PAMC26577_13830 [Caballeronia sordidicola]
MERLFCHCGCAVVSCVIKAGGFDESAITHSCSIKSMSCSRNLRMRINFRHKLIKHLKLGSRTTQYFLSKSRV